MTIDRRNLFTGGASLFGALALTAVAGDMTLAEAAENHPHLDPHQSTLLPNLSTVTTTIDPVMPRDLDAHERKLLATFDELDFVVYSGQQWDRFGESHAPDVRVHNPDGTFTDGLQAHIEALKFQFLWAPDTRVVQHPIKIVNGNLTAVVGIGKGTFTQPMPLPDGSAIPPTGKPFQMSMTTVARWNHRNLIKEEFLFLDLQSIQQQIGLA